MARGGKSKNDRPGRRGVVDLLARVLDLERRVDHLRVWLALAVVAAVVALVGGFLWGASFMLHRVSP